MRVAVLVGESYFLSLLPELQKHVDGVIIVDIDDKVLQHCQFLQTLMTLCSDRENFASLYFLMNIIVRENWSIPCFDPETKRKIEEIPPSAEYATMFMLNSGERLGEKHFLHTDSRLFRCQESFEKMFFSFVKLDLFNSRAVKQFQDTLQKHQAIISILNLTNLADYDENFPLLDIKKKLSPPVKLHENLKLLCSPNDELTILYSRADRATNYDKVTSCQTSSVSKYIERIESYYEELKLHAKGIGEITRGMKYAGDYGRIFSGKSKTPEVTGNGTVTGSSISMTHTK